MCLYYPEWSSREYDPILAAIFIHQIKEAGLGADTLRSYLTQFRKTEEAHAYGVIALKF